MKFVELTDAEFNNFERKVECGNFFQGAERAELRRQMGWDVHLLGVKNKDKVVAGSMLMARDGEALIQLGPILDYSDTKLLKFWVDGVLDFARKQGYIDIEIYPVALLSVRDVHGEVLESHDLAKVEKIFAEAGFDYMGRTVEMEPKANRWMAVKDLAEYKDADELRSSYKKNVRNKLRKISGDLEVYILKDKSEIPMIVDVVDQSNAKNSVISRKLDYYEKIWDIYGENTKFVVARTKDTKEVAAGRVLIYHPNEIVSFISGTARKHMKLNGMTYLQEWLLQDSLEKGVKRVNFYGIDGDFSKENKLLEFKAGFGVKILEYLGGYRYLLKPGVYKRRKAVAKAKHSLRKIKYAMKGRKKLQNS